MDELLQKITNPPSEYRAIPFWSWNDRLEPEMLQWQIREMKKAGLGGYFMHARGGLQTPYLGDEWMECIRASIEEGKRQGMGAWCYDEEGWPSGFAGGIVTAMGDKCHVRWLELEEGGSVKESAQVLGVYVLDGDRLLRIASDRITRYGEEGRRIFTVGHRSNSYYIDILNKDVVKAFIESTYDKYYSRFGEEFGKGMSGFFTDEPQFARGGIPWSYILPEAFLERYGYDLLEVLPALFLECEGYTKVRYDFWQLVSELYVTAFGKQIYEWCKTHGCQFTGHVMCEDNLHAQMGATAGAMPFYEYMHIPGMDWLGRAIESPVIPKQVGSAANQLGKKFVLSETFALCGWDVSFEELKWIAEWQYVNGVTLMCQHLEGYTLRGLRKRDYPPSMFYQQPWWEEYRLFNDYFARLGMVLTAGRSAVEVLLLHPIRSAWVEYNHGKNGRLEKLDEEFRRATVSLAEMHVDHHYGDETLLMRHGRVEGKTLAIGNCRYQAVILPFVVTLDKKTVEMLNTFLDNGGTVISLGELPGLCGGVEDAAIHTFNNRLTRTGEDYRALYRLLRKRELVSVSISDRGDEIGAIHYQQRDLGSQQAYFMVNHSQQEAYSAVVTLKGEGRAMRLDLESAQTCELPYTCEDGNTRVQLEFMPMQSHMLLLDTGAETQKHMGNPEPPPVYRIKPGEEWEIEQADRNALTLDFCSYSINQGEWEGPVPVIRLMNILLDRRERCDMALRFEFNVAMEPCKCEEIFLAVEAAEEFNITVNGKTVMYKDTGWWKDSSFKKIDIRDLVRRGCNEIILRREFYQSQKVYDVLFGEDVLETEKNKLTFDTELESIYVIGDFGVISQSAYTCGDRKAVFSEGPFVITDKPQKIQDGDLTEQGFCFFAGTVRLGQELQLPERTEGRIILELGRPNAVLSSVLVNGRLVRTIPWAPYQADITDYLQPGSNRLSVKLYSGNRNLLGPHHHARGELYAVCPSSFSEKEGWGAEDQPDQWRDRYCFVKFGL